MKSEKERGKPEGVVTLSQDQSKLKQSDVKQGSDRGCIC